MIKIIIFGVMILQGTFGHHEMGSNECRDSEKSIDVPTENAKKGFTLVNGAEGIENTTDLVFIINSGDKIQYFPCPGVMLSKVHVLMSTHCHPEVNSKVMFHYKADLEKKTEEFVNGSVTEVLEIDEGAHMLVLKMDKELTEDSNRKIMKLPEKNCEVGEKFGINGWSFMPERAQDDIFYDNFLMHQGEVKVVGREDCQDLKESEACVKMEATEKVHKMMIGSPIIHEDKIIGLAHFDCNTQGAMSLVFPWVEKIKTLIA